MALNRARERANQVSFPVADGTESGDIVMVGDIPALALTDEGAWTDGEATVQMECSVYLDVSVAIDAGDIIYDHSGTFNKTSSGGTRIGIALTSVGAGGGEIEVKLCK